MASELEPSFTFLTTQSAMNFQWSINKENTRNDVVN